MNTTSKKKKKGDTWGAMYNKLKNEQTDYEKSRRYKLETFWGKILCFFGHHADDSGYTLEEIKLSKRVTCVHDLQFCYRCNKVTKLASFYTDGKTTW